MIRFLLTTTCDNCGSDEERTFRDSWSGKELCLGCLAPVVNQLTMSPSEGDNIEELLESLDEAAG